MDQQEAPTRGYGPADVQRWVPEPTKRSGRTAFQRDRARVLHSAALRRLAAKTQVVGPSTDDFARNRLTHSLEVAQIGRELGSWLGCDPDLVETACLAHDLGHPPFGHNGEQALDAAAAGCGGFEGNAQTLRVLTRLEGKTFTDDGRSAGLNLTRAALDACVKYPWARGADTAKFGFYDADAAVFGWAREPVGAAGTRRCLEAQVMDFADDVAYSVHDVEDGVVAGAIDLRWLADPTEREGLAAVVRGWYLAEVSGDELGECLDRLAALPWWPQGWDGGRRALAALKSMTSQLIGRFCLAVQEATHAVAGSGTLTRYDADVVLPRATAVEIAALKAVAARYVMQTAERGAVLASERELIAELVDLLWRRGPQALDPEFAADWAGAPDDAARLRVVLDQVASLTDPSAVALHARLRAG